MLSSILKYLPDIFKFLNNITIRPSKEIRRVVTIYDTMHRVLEETPVERFIIFKAHNGGGLIKSSTPLYVSALYEDYTAPFKTVKEFYQKIQVDEEYLRMLLALTQQKNIKIITEDLKPCLLKGIYEGEGVKYAEIYYLGQDRKNLYLCSCATSKEGGWEDNPYQKLAVDRAILIIKNNIK